VLLWKDEGFSFDLRLFKNGTTQIDDLEFLVKRDIEEK
jgi:hypothetical protein